MAAKVAVPQMAHDFTQPREANWAYGVPGDEKSQLRIAHSELNGTISVPERKRMVTRSKKNVRDESLMGNLCRLICDHQLGLSVNLVLLLLLTHMCFPRARGRTTKFLHLSYYNPETGMYGQGLDDLYFVVSWVVIVTGLRVAVMDYILHPLAAAGGIRTRKAKVRFVEQAWLLVYTPLFFSLGLYIISQSEYWLNLKGMWTNWPIRELTGLFKWYYLVQFAFWVQQILVVNVEEKRKDYAQMFVHHIITSTLMFFSYGCYQTRIGNVILCLMDSVDIFLPAAKILKYLGYNTICDVAFGMFMAVWLLARHILYLMVCWSIYADAPVEIPTGCYLADNSVVRPGLDPEGYDLCGGHAIWRNLLAVYIDPKGPTCWGPGIASSFLGLLLALHGIILLWFAMIVRVAWKVINGTGADDSRSDDEGDAEDEEVDVEELAESGSLHSSTGARGKPDLAPLEEDVGVESLNLSRRTSPGVRGYRRSSGRGGGGGRASGISIPGHGDRKELLGRIGCDKPS